MSNENYDPEFLAELDKEAEFVNSSGRKSYVRRFQLKDAGESAVIRVIPYSFDDKKRFFARVARHWVNGRPFICTKDTALEHGGDPDGKCAICDLVDDLNRSRDKKVSDTAYRMSAVTQWLVYILVYEIRDRRGNITYKPRNSDELLKPHEFWLYKEPFSDILLLYKNFLRRHPEQLLSILDPEKGCDLLVTKAKRGYRFEREDPQAIGKNPVEMMEKALKNVEYKVEAALEGDDLDDLLLKIEDVCKGGGRGRDDDRRGGGRGRDMDLDEDDDRRGDSRRSSSRDDDRRSSSRDDDRRPASRGDDRRSSRDDDSRSSRSRDLDDDRRPSRSERSSRDDDRRPASRDNDRPAPKDDDRRPSRDDDDDSRSSRRAETDDRRSSRDDDRRGERTEDRRPSREADDDRRPASRDDDRRSSSRDDEPRGAVTESEDEGEDRRGRRAEDLDEGEDDRDPPPALSRSTERRGATPPPPPAAGRGSVSNPPPARSSEPKDEDDDLPEGDKEKVPPVEPAPGEVVDSKAEAPATASATTAPATGATPQGERKFQSTLGAALQSRISSHSTRR